MKKMFYTVPEAAELVGFSLRYFRTVIGRDRIPIVQIGRKFFILKRDIDSWRRTQKVEISK